MRTTDEIIDGISAVMKEKGMTARQLADASNVPKSTVDRILRKATPNPSMQNILDMAGAVGYHFGDPIPEKPKHQDVDQQMKYMIHTYEDQIARLRAHYTMLIAEKNRWINYLFMLSLALVVFCIILLFVFQRELMFEYWQTICPINRW